MPIIVTRLEEKHLIIFPLRIFSGLIWLGTVIRRLESNYGDFESRITAMGQGDTIFPDSLMKLAVENWFSIYLLVITIEILVSISLLTGTLSRGGAFLGTVNGIGIGMAGVGLGIIDLIIPWTAALITLILFLFTHPGKYKGFDRILDEKKLPKVIKLLI